MHKYAILALALYVCLVSCKDEVCKDLSANKLFRDPKDPHKYHQCSYGTDKGAITCAIAGEIFDESQQTCIQPVVTDKACPAADGHFAYPGNPHKFIVCYQGHGYVLECAANTVWDDGRAVCVDNTEGKTWAPAF